MNGILVLLIFLFIVCALQRSTGFLNQPICVRDRFTGTDHPDRIQTLYGCADWTCLCNHYAIAAPTLATYVSNCQRDAFSMTISDDVVSNFPVSQRGLQEHCYDNVSVYKDCCNDKYYRHDYFRGTSAWLLLSKSCG